MLSLLAMSKKRVREEIETSEEESCEEEVSEVKLRSSRKTVSCLKANTFLMEEQFQAEMKDSEFGLFNLNVLSNSLSKNKH